ncbi:MAG: N-acetylmuramoyl-L-alanine amidase [Shimia sp.]|uniref:N-acetylmuramoyl-L-alanine amidase n=1 Tax=Shimia sp. TaxID=1954381 RepID=UPI0040593414
MAPAPDLIDFPSPNFGPRRDGLRPELIVLHYTAMKTAEAALERLCDPIPEVSAHYLICEKGRVFKLVDEEMRAWHAGAGTWQGKGDINSRSIGIELDNRGTHPFSEPQMVALETLLPTIMARWNIAASSVIGHSDMAPGRKFDPGPRFDWRRLAFQNLALWPDAEPAEGLGTDWATAATQLGYDTTQKEALSAFRMRFRPYATGPLDREDARIAAHLTATLP